MFCINCGGQLPEGARFCPNCGTPVTPPAAPAPPEPPPPPDPIRFPGAGFPGDELLPPSAPVVFTPPGPDPPSPPQPPEAGEQPPVPMEEFPGPEPSAPGLEPPVPAPPTAGPAPVSAPASLPACAAPAADGGQSSAKRPERTAVFVVLGVIAVAAAVLVVLLVRLLGGLFGGGQSALVYLNDDGELIYLSGPEEKALALKLTDEADYSAVAHFSPDGKTVYFTDSDSTLYGVTVSELRQGGRPRRVARDVSTVQVLKDGRLLYAQFDGPGRYRLCVYDKGETFRLARSCAAHELSADQKTLYYIQLDGAVDLYRMPVARDARAERLVKGATALCTGYDSDPLVYVTGSFLSSGSGGDPLAVYACAPGGSKTKLVEGAYTITDVTVDQGRVSFYYYMEDAQPGGQTSYSLYHYDGGEAGAPIATRIRAPYDVVSSPAHGIFLYRKAQPAGASRMAYPAGTADTARGGDQWYQNVGGVEREIDLEDAAEIYGIYVLDGREALLDVCGEDGENLLLSFTIGKDALTFSSTVLDGGEFAAAGEAERSGRDALYLFTGLEDADNGIPGDFCVYQNGGLETIAREVYHAYIPDKSGGAYVVTDVDEEFNLELALLKGGKLSVIAGEMSEYPLAFLDGQRLLYLSGGDLYLWDGRQSRRLARDVEDFWAAGARDFHYYDPYSYYY